MFYWFHEQLLHKDWHPYKSWSAYSKTNYSFILFNQAVTGVIRKCTSQQNIQCIKWGIIRYIKCCLIICMLLPHFLNIHTEMIICNWKFQMNIFENFTYTFQIKMTYHATTPESFYNNVITVVQDPPVRTSFRWFALVCTSLLAKEHNKYSQASGSLSSSSAKAFMIPNSWCH